MPGRGYRKGISDRKVPAPKRIHTRLPIQVDVELSEDANSRNTTKSRILAELAAAHYANRRPELPQRRGLTTATIRELARIGNNLNQLTRQANSAIVPVNAAELQATLTAVLATIQALR